MCTLSRNLNYGDLNCDYILGTVNLRSLMPHLVCFMKILCTIGGKLHDS